MLVNQEKIDFLQEHNVSLHISLNGDIQTNDTLRDSSTQIVLHNIKKFLSPEQKKNVYILFAF